MRLKMLTIRDVAEGQLCSGCGVCASAFPDAIEMTDVLDYGRRPRARAGVDAGASAAAMQEALAVCPGIALEHDESTIGPEPIIEALRAGWGPVRALWEGYAADDAIRFAGSSGGAASALALYAIEAAGMSGVIHAAARSDVPYLNETVISRSRDELLERTGSRYAPASPGDGLHLMQEDDRRVAFIGKPCDVAGLNKLRAIRPEIDARIGITIAFFCAGVPSTRGTLELIRKNGIDDPAAIRSVRYRGNGWPGMWTVRADTPQGEKEVQMTYAESWGFLQRYRQWRCYICPDHTGEFADIAVGDPWYREVQRGESGSSLILARTQRGRDFIEAAIAAGYLIAQDAPANMLPDSQPNLLGTRGALWGRLLALRVMFAPRPVFRGMPMFRYWRTQLSAKEKVQSIYGTIRRIFTKNLRRRVDLVSYDPQPSHHPITTQSRR
ncbi:MAG: Coenzyme F420 hydrogenase/dehydrogenase, beta subunit C-terminal domain [Phycisphaerales bacterium]